MELEQQRLPLRQRSGDGRAGVRRPPARHGGGLRVCGCLWRVASDDFVFPAAAELVGRCAGLSVLVGVYVYEETTPAEHTCAAEHNLNTYLLVAIVLFAAVIANLILLGTHSARGHIWDGGGRARRWVAPLVYLNLVLTLGEFFWALVGTVWAVRGLAEQCIQLTDADGMSANDGALIAVFIVILLTWVGLSIKVLLSCAAFNSLHCCCGDGGKSDDKRVVARLAAAASEPDGGLLSRACSLWMEKGNIEMFQQIATLIDEVFDDDEFVPTDIAAALLLLYARHEDEAAAVVTRPPGAIRVAPSPSSPPSTASSSKFGHAASPPPAWSAVGGRSRNAGDEHVWKDVDVVKHFMQYAGAAYGYTWFLMQKPSDRSFRRLRRHLLCCGCFSCFTGDISHIEGDNCLGCNTAALKATLPHLEDESIVHVSFKNRLTETPYYVVADHRYKKIVVSIRGTLSLEDTITDLAAMPVPIADASTDPSMAGLEAHGGMLRAARNVYAELRDRHVLDKAFSYFDDYGLVVTGHSLGAGTAVVLAFLLRRKFPDLKCYAYCPPGCVLNEAAAKVSHDFVLSLVFGQDWISRLSIESVLRLKSKMKQVLVQCRVPKYQILAHGCCFLCVKDWRSGLRRASIAAAVPEGAESEEASSSANSEAPIVAATASRPRMARPNYESLSSAEEGGGIERQSSLSPSLHAAGRMVVPGVIWHLDLADNCYRMTEKEPGEFEEILVSPQMVTDHLPHTVCQVLAAVRPMEQLSQRGEGEIDDNGNSEA